MKFKFEPMRKRPSTSKKADLNILPDEEEIKEEEQKYVPPELQQEKE